VIVDDISDEALDAVLATEAFAKGLRLAHDVLLKHYLT